jgi:outer membrane protein OmpA-like peptidoglycan-associated protein
MPGYAVEGRSGKARVQATGNRAKNLGHVLLACGLLVGCSDPLSKPVDLFHNLEGGEIAAQRPPPPGAGQPYPHVGLVPEKPVMPDPAFRKALQNELATERDDKALMVSDIPLEKIPPPRPAQPAAPPPASPVAAAPPPAVTAGAPGQKVPADAAPPPETGESLNATIPAAEPAAPAKPATAAPAPALPQDAALQIVGDAVDTRGVPLVPDAPPPPATFEGMPAAPAPTPRMLPPHLAAPAGTPVYFAQGSNTLAPSQTQTLRDLAAHRKNRTILVTGQGEADSDTPGGQETAIDLALHRARTITDAFAAMHVPQGAMRIAARPFGRGAVLTLLP